MIAFRVPVLPMSYQRYSTNKAGLRFKPKELRSYQDVVAVAALAAGFRPHEWNQHLRADMVFVVPPEALERKLARTKPSGPSACRKDVDNMVKAVLDGLQGCESPGRDAWNDRFVVEVRAAKIWHREEAERGVLVRLQQLAPGAANDFHLELARAAGRAC